MIPTGHLQGLMGPGWQAIEQDAWPWVVGGPQATGESGVLYEVQALVVAAA